MPDEELDLPTAWSRAQDDTIDLPTAWSNAEGASSSKPPSPAADGSHIVAAGSSQIGQTGRTINDFLRQHGQTLDATKNNWCVAYVNSALNANGIEGTTGPGKYVATSFLKWGQPVQSAPQPGDVLVQPRGRPAGVTGGHVGIATGHVADGPNGQSYYLMQSGNYKDRVAYSWEPANTLVVRRASPKQADR